MTRCKICGRDKILNAGKIWKAYKKELIDVGIKSEDDLKKRISQQRTFVQQTVFTSPTKIPIFGVGGEIIELKTLPPLTEAGYIEGMRPEITTTVFVLNIKTIGKGTSKRIMGKGISFRLKTEELVGHGTPESSGEPFWEQIREVGDIKLINIPKQEISLNVLFDFYKAAKRGSQLIGSEIIKIEIISIGKGGEMLDLKTGTILSGKLKRIYEYRPLILDPETRNKKFPKSSLISAEKKERIYGGLADLPTTEVKQRCPECKEPLVWVKTSPSGEKEEHEWQIEQGKEVIRKDKKRINITIN